MLEAKNVILVDVQRVLPPTNKITFLTEAETDCNEARCGFTTTIHVNTDVEELWTNTINSYLTM